jgi:hypothetical protein
MSKTLDGVCKDLLKEVNDGLGVAVVDIQSGLLLSVAHNIPYFTQSYLDAVAAAAVEMFQGRTVANVEKMIANQRGTEFKHLIKEVQMTTDRTYHFMAIVPQKPNALLVLITGRKANLGMGWAAVRGALPDIAPLCP